MLFDNSHHITLVLSFCFACCCSPRTFPLVTLNWSEYTGVAGGWGLTASVPFWATFIKLFIMLFPVFNMLSVYPLICVSLGDNLVRFHSARWLLCHYTFAYASASALLTSALSVVGTLALCLCCC